MVVSPPTDSLRRRRAPRGSGDLLRDEILDAATELLLDTGHAKAVSIRSVAERVGVTPPSIYLHFQDKDALLDAVCARYFEKLDEEMQRVSAGQSSTVEVLRAQGLAYVRFATENPELYRIATMGEWRSGSNVDSALASSAFAHMCAAVGVLMDEGVFPRGDAAAVALELWSAAHGAASLLIAKPHLPFGDAEAFTDRVLRAVFLGHMVAGLVGVDATPEQVVEQLTALKSSVQGSSCNRSERLAAMTSSTADTVDHPFFARIWPAIAAHETEQMRELRRENLAGLSGRVLEVGAGTGTNFELYPDSVAQVVAVEPEQRLAGLAREAAAGAAVPIEVTNRTVESFSADEPFDAVVCSLVLCSVADPDSVLRQLFSLLRPGGELRYLEHVASGGIRGRFQQLVDATIWPRLAGNCHTHRDTEQAIRAAGFDVDKARTEQALPAWVPLPVSEFVLGRARRPA